MKYRMALAATLLVINASAFAEGGARIQWQCQETGRNSAVCQFQNLGSAPGGICMDVVKMCRDGDHTFANLCSDRLSPGDVDNKVISSYNPKIHLLTKCIGVEFRNKVLN